MTPVAEDGAELVSLDEAIVPLMVVFADVLDRVRKHGAGHRTAWADGPVSMADQPSPPQRMFLFVTLDPSAAPRAMEALRAAGVLCETDLGGFVVEGDRLTRTREPGASALTTQEIGA